MLPRLPYWKLKPTMAKLAAEHIHKVIDETYGVTVRCNNRRGEQVCLLLKGHDGPHAAEGYTWRDTPADFNGRLEWQAVPDSLTQGRSYFVVSSEGLAIALVYSASHEENLDARGNAELMAASGRMLKLLEEELAAYPSGQSVDINKNNWLSRTRQLVRELKEKLQ